MNRNVNVNGGGYNGGCYNCGYGYSVGRAVATTAAVVGTAAVIGSIVNSVPSSGCQQVISNGMVYQYCNGTYYQPMASGSTTQYVVVNPPG